MEGFPIPWAHLTFAETLRTVSRYMKSNKERTNRKVMGGGKGILEPQEFFSLSNSLYEFFLGNNMNIF